MNCLEAREAMLIAELSELRGTGNTPLAAHIASCHACHQIGGALGCDARRLSASIAKRTSRRIALFAAIPAAAAAIVIITTIAHREAPVTRQPPAALRPAHVVSVDVAPGQRAAVLKTSDPNVTLVWLAPGAN
jgi:hypothetical protein